MPVGTILYVPGLKKYAIVDDVSARFNWFSTVVHPFLT